MFEKKKYIYEVYKERSFSKAAQKLFISQPALSSIIAKEEQKIGVPLFDRSTSPISLTPVGQQYISCCENLFLIEDNFTKYLNDMQALASGRLAVGSNHIFMSTVLPDIVSHFTTLHPSIQFELIDLDSDALKKQLNDGSLDLVIDNNKLDDRFFENIAIGAECMLLAVPKEMEINEHLADCRLTYEDIVADTHLDKRIKCVDMTLFNDVPFILMHKGYDTRIRANEIFSSFSISPKILFEMNQLAAVFSVISSGLAASFISDTLIKKAANPSVHLYYYKVDHPSAIRMAYIQKKKNKYMTRAAEEFIRFTHDFHPFTI